MNKSIESWSSNFDFKQENEMDNFTRKSKFQINNLLKLKDLWELTLPATVDLGDWARDTDCGAVACLGGHAALSGFFSRSMRLLNITDGDVVYKHPTLGHLYSSETAEYLFGDRDLFDAHKADERHMTPWEAAYSRIVRALDEIYVWDDESSDYFGYSMEGRSKAPKHSDSPDEDELRAIRAYGIGAAPITL